MNDKELLLRIRKELQSLKRGVYGLMKIEKLPGDKYIHLSNAYWELEKLATKIGDDLEQGE